jgi:hypothetical protein
VLEIEPSWARAPTGLGVRQVVSEDHLAGEDCRMSLLMFSLAPESVTLLTDTLATTPAGDPHLLVTKCGIVPHLDLVVAGTGIAQLTEHWRAMVYGQMLCRDIDMLDAHCPGALRRLWANLEAEHPDPIARGATATVYHLGLSEARSEYVGYVYRSTHGFASEPMAPGFRVKPQPAEALAETPTAVHEMIELAHRLRTEQNAQPASERVHIGGELSLTVLADRSIIAVKVHRYDDFETIWQQMNDAQNWD